ncbi:MAG TPA: GPW/gp25 family protein [Verrucomicrobiae bacterium]
MIPAPPIGWPLLPSPDDDGQLAWPALERSVADQIRVILLTRPGEQLMRPGFGAGLENFLHEPNTLNTRRRIHDLILSALKRWEKRILLDDVAVNEVRGEPARVRVEICYRLRRTGAAGRTGITLDLGA